jgi:tRNA U34 5-methylaminomethyl-2-thiouridine-forming methyltransferase MnmC
MNRTVQITADGSQTIAIDDIQVTYHSRHGAMKESIHVFIEAGLNYVLLNTKKEQLSIFEMVFGTGLNALLTLDIAERKRLDVYYYTIEKFPLETDEWNMLLYGEQLQLQPEFEKLHNAEWSGDIQITDRFVLHKSQRSLLKQICRGNLILFILMLLLQGHNQRYGLKMFSKRCTVFLKKTEYW